MQRIKPFSDTSIRQFYTDLRDKNTEINQISNVKLIDGFLNVGSGNRPSILQLSHNTDIEQFNTFAKTLQKLIRKGIVGYEYLEVNNRPYKSFITTRIGDQALSNAKPYRRNMVA